jgi:hypothetical protein
MLVHRNTGIQEKVQIFSIAYRNCRLAAACDCFKMDHGDENLVKYRNVAEHRKLVKYRKLSTTRKLNDNFAFGRMKTGIIAISCLAIVAMVFSTTAALAVNPPMNLSFQASAGNAAGWVVGPGSSHSEAYLTVNTPGDSFAVIDVHHFPAALPKVEPSFTATHYLSGTPRIFIYMSDGDYAFIFPVGSGVALEAVINGSPSTSITTYSGFVQHEVSQGATVGAVYIVADTSQQVPYTAYITYFQYAGVELIG